MLTSEGEKGLGVSPKMGILAQGISCLIKIVEGPVT